MKLDDISELYQLISGGRENLPSRKQAILLRKASIESCVKGFTKLAFDTRRIDQETTYNPRRGLQNYHRSEPFVSESMFGKITALSKLSTVLNQLKQEYEQQPEWQDSYARILNQSVLKGLRTVQADGDYSETQPSMASLSYLEELLHVRYRLSMDDLTKMSSVDLRKSILSKDELLIHGSSNYNITTNDITKHSYEELMIKLFANMNKDSFADKLFNVKATQENPNVERTVIITIKDSLDKTTSKKD